MRKCFRFVFFVVVFFFYIVCFLFVCILVFVFETVDDRSSLLSPAGNKDSPYRLGGMML